MPSAKISFLSAIFKIPYLRLFVCVLVSLGTKSNNVSFIPAPIAGPNRREEPDVLQKLILLYPRFVKKASPFLKIFLKKVVSRSLSTIKTFIFFPFFHLTLRSNPLNDRFRTLKTRLKSRPNTRSRQAHLSSDTFKRTRTSSTTFIRAHPSSAKLTVHCRVHLSSAKLTVHCRVHLSSAKLKTDTPARPAHLSIIRIMSSMMLTDSSR